MTLMGCICVMTASGVPGSRDEVTAIDETKAHASGHRGRRPAVRELSFALSMAAWSV
jgi:hypothetical protein